MAPIAVLGARFGKHLPRQIAHDHRQQQSHHQSFRRHSFFLPFRKIGATHGVEKLHRQQRPRPMRQRGKNATLVVVSQGKSITYT